VFVTDSSDTTYTNSLKGSKRPFISLTFNDDRSKFYVDEPKLLSAMFKADSDRNKLHDLSKVYLKAFPKKLNRNPCLDLATPILLRCAYNTKIKQESRLVCIANNLRSSETKEITKEIMDEYNLKGNFSDVKASLEELIES